MLQNKQNVGKNKIYNLMSNLSKHLKLSKKYTNHSLRVTHITVLKENGFNNCEIAANTGHKSIPRVSSDTTEIDRLFRKYVGCIHERDIRQFCRN